MPKYFFALLFLLNVFSKNGLAQDTLPKISVINHHGKIIISWKNAYGATISNINIQRSTDSIKKFTTIGTVLNPTNIENGYVDSKPTGNVVFYRLFVAFAGGEYIFTRSYRPVIDTMREKQIDMPSLPALKDNGRDLISADDKKNEDKKDFIKPVKPPVFVPSKYVFTGKDNNVIISLPEAPSQKYAIHFFDELDNPLFEIRSVKEPYLILEKVNFLRAGWFKYDLYHNDVLEERSKFFIPKDSKASNSGKDQRSQ